LVGDELGGLAGLFNDEVERGTVTTISALGTS